MDNENIIKKAEDIIKNGKDTEDYLKAKKLVKKLLKLKEKGEIKTLLLMDKTNNPVSMEEGLSLVLAGIAEVFDGTAEEVRKDIGLICTSTILTNAVSKENIEDLEALKHVIKTTCSIMYRKLADYIEEWVRIMKEEGEK